MSSSPPNKFYTPAADKTLEQNIADFGAKLDAQIQKEEAQRPKPEAIKDSEEDKKQEEAQRPETIQMSSLEEMLKATMELLQESMKVLEEVRKEMAATSAAWKAQRRLKRQLNIDMVSANGWLPAKRARKDINYFKK